MIAVRLDHRRIALQRWWHSLDHELLILVGLLVFAGIIAIIAASPSHAQRIGISSSHFIVRHSLFIVAGLLTMAVTSMLPAKWVFRLGGGVLIAALIALLLVPLLGETTKGAQRWLSLPGGFSLQPSEFVKPGLIVAIAWLLGRKQPPTWKSSLIVAGMTLLICAWIAMQPDITQSLLIAAVVMCLFFVAETSRIILVMGLGAMAATFIGAYRSVPYVSRRINDYLTDWSGNDTAIGYQADTAARAIEAGGFWGVGAGSGSFKRSLPDAHSDFIFAVMVEEYGALICLLILIFYFWIIHKILFHAAHEAHAPKRLALTGFALLLGIQVAINIGVNIALLPTTGISLPLISYGGSSFLATAWLFGMVFALGRNATMTSWLSPDEHPNHSIPAKAALS